MCVCSGAGDSSVSIAAVNNVTFNLSEGEFATIMVPSGSGKSTLMNCLTEADTLTENLLFSTIGTKTKSFDLSITNNSYGPDNIPLVESAKGTAKLIVFLKDLVSMREIKS